MADRLGHRVGQVVQQVPSVGDLDGGGCAAGGAFGVAAGPVPADHLDPRVFVEPGGQAVGGAIVEHVDHPAAGHVDQHGPVAVAASPGEVIDAQRC